MFESSAFFRVRFSIRLLQECHTSRKRGVFGAESGRDGKAEQPPESVRRGRAAPFPERPVRAAALFNVDRIKRGEPVRDPDRIVSMKVGAEAA
jgi:hypothetical protein